MTRKYTTSSVQQVIVVGDLLCSNLNDDETETVVKDTSDVNSETDSQASGSAPPNADLQGQTSTEVRVRGYTLYIGKGLKR